MPAGEVRYTELSPVLFKDFWRWPPRFDRWETGRFLIQAPKPHGQESRTGSYAQASDQQSKPHGCPPAPTNPSSLADGCARSSRNQEETRARLLGELPKNTTIRILLGVKILIEFRPHCPGSIHYSV